MTAEINASCGRSRLDIDDAVSAANRSSRRHLNHASGEVD